MGRPSRSPRRGWADRKRLQRERMRKDPLAEMRELEAIRIRNLKPFNERYWDKEPPEVYSRLRTRLASLLNEPDERQFEEQFRRFRVNYQLFRDLFRDVPIQKTLSALDRFIIEAAFAPLEIAKPIVEQLLEKYRS